MSVTAITLMAARQTNAQIAVTGTLNTGEGYKLVATQDLVTDSQASDGGGPGGASAEATASSTGDFTNLSNAYAFIDSSNNLNLFIGGSMEEDNDSKYYIALQTTSGGVTNLNGQTIAGAANNSSIDKVVFTTASGSFAPTSLFVVYPGGATANSQTVMNGAPHTTYTGGAVYGVSYTDLTGHGYAAPADVNAVLNNDLENTPVGAGGSGDPGFAGASTGLELSIPLTSLGYTPGSDVKAFVFPTIGQDGRTNDQELSPFTSFADSNGYDYTYIDNNNSLNGNPDRQFDQGVYPGIGYFDIAGYPTPEPASLSVLALGGLALLRRRTQKRSV
jgi:MYXO-CTERM domain-containing protein